MTTPLTLIVEGKPLVFDVPAEFDEVIPAGTWFLDMSDETESKIYCHPYEVTCSGPGLFTARPPVAPESFADGDVAWVRVERATSTTGDAGFIDPDEEWAATDSTVRRWIEHGNAFALPSPRPESLADVLDDLGLTGEQRARVEEAVQR